MVFLLEILVSILIACLSGLLPLIVLKWRPRLVKILHVLLIFLFSSGLLIGSFLALIKKVSLTLTIPLGVPLLHWSLRLDCLAAFFLCLIGIIGIAISFYGASYLRHYENTKQSICSLIIFTGLFLASMCLVILADDIFSFITAWELMSLTSYFLVIYPHHEAENRRAGFIYLLMAHLSGLLILAAFGVLAKFSTGLDFYALHSAHLTSLWLGLAFLLAFLGFGMKAGLVPLHVWLPEAHPVAPAHISALMSGVMLKVAVYGFIRFSFYLIGQLHWQWGVLVLFVGSLSALFGILYAIMQHDLKRLLAYSSVENIGIIFIGLGLAIIFLNSGHPILGALGLIAALYHCLNHALFKSLLFLGAGSILQHTHEHDLEHMGGLIHSMPQTAFFFLIGCISIAALPPFNGFVSEWLTFQTALQVSVLHSDILRVAIPVAAAVLALTGALAAASFAKVYGIAFLGKARTRHVQHAKETEFGVRLALGWLALLCLLLGIFSVLVIYLLNFIPATLLHVGLTNFSVRHWLWLTPFSSQISTYSPGLVFVGLVIACLIIYFIFKRMQYSFLFKKVPAWDCGFGGLTRRMQYTAAAFAMPIRRVFHGVWEVKETCQIEDAQPLIQAKYELQIKDWFWIFLYSPLDSLVQKVAKKLARLQKGNIRIYLAYMFFTLLLLLFLLVVS